MTGSVIYKPAAFEGDWPVSHSVWDPDSSVGDWATVTEALGTIGIFANGSHYPRDVNEKWKRLWEKKTLMENTSVCVIYDHYIYHKKVFLRELHWGYVIGMKEVV